MTDETGGTAPADGAPVEVESPTTTAEAAVTEQPTDDAGSREPEQPRDEKGRFESFQKRIDKVTWEKHEAERRAEFYRQQLEQRQPQAPQPAAVPDKPPTLESVGFDETKFQQALVDYAVRVAEAKAEAKVAERLKAHEEQQRAKTREQSFAEKVSAFEKDTPDYREAISDPYLPFQGELLEHIYEVGPQLAYYLGKNPEVARAIAALPSIAMAREIGKIEAKLTAPKAATPQVTRTPPPPPKIAPSADTGISVKPTDSESDKAMSDSEWMRAREKQLRRKA